MKPILVLLGCLGAAALWGQGDLKAGAARRDITPREPVPMWGYASRHGELSQGTLDPLYAEIVVLEEDGKRLALVSLDLGRAPNERSLERLRKRLRDESGVEWSFLSASHTHHGPVLELSDEPGKGQGKFDAALRYYGQLEISIAEGVAEAVRNLKPARLAAASAQVSGFNRNRQSKLTPAVSDRELGVLRVEDVSGTPIALAVSFSAHPTMLPADTMRFSADWVGVLKNRLRAQAAVPVLFWQGSSGDQSVDRAINTSIDSFGQALGEEVLKLRPELVAGVRLQVREDRLRFPSRIEHSNPIVQAAFKAAFFNELVPNYADEYKDGVRPRLTVATLGPDLALVGVSGEFFSGHALSLKQRARLKNLFFLGYTNGYHQYFPTIEAVAEGGYGTNLETAAAELGAGETVINKSLLWLYQMRGSIR